MSISLGRRNVLTLTRIRTLILAFVLLSIATTGCASTAPAVAETEADRIADEMRQRGLQMSNLRSVPVSQSRTKAIVESRGFDIPGIDTEGRPAGTIQIYRDERTAETDRQVFKLLGNPGPETKLDYLTIEGRSGLLLDHRLPAEVAERYIEAFSVIQQ